MSIENAIVPKAKKVPKTLEKHGHKRIDPYFWLNDRENEEVIAYLEKENAYCDEVMKPTEAFQDQLYHEIVGRIKQNDESVPYKKNGYWYYVRYEEKGEYPLYCRKKETLEAEEEILLDGNSMGKDLDYFHIGSLSVSPDNTLLVYSTDTVGRRQYTLFVKNLTTGKLLDVSIERTTGSGTWANDNKTLFYTRKDEKTLRSNQVFKHKLGQEGEDQVVYEEKDETFYTGIFKSKSQQYLIIWSSSTLTNDYRILKADEPHGEFEPFAEREIGLEYSVSHFEDQFYVITNWDAKNFRLMSTPENKTDKENWKEIIPHRAEVYLEGIETFKNFLVVEERSRGLTHLRVIDQRTNQEHYVDFGEEAYTAYSSVNVEFETVMFRFGYTSMATPFSTFDYNMETREKILKKQQEVVGGYEPSDYRTERLYATARDGEKIPISLVYKKSLKQAEGNPLLLYGYGSYGSTIDPAFSATRLSLLDRGFVFAIAHIRGGQLLGRDWYEKGKLMEKKNTFFDFIDVAMHLIKKGFTTPDKLFAQGGSAGGLLMGAVINENPELFKGVIAQVPFVDVMTTMLDDSIPLTTGEYDEWGNPNHHEAYEYMLSYSPYDNVKAQDYPNMLVTTGLHDSQVQYWEPAKWVAKLRDVKTDNNLLLLKTNMEAGHGGASGRFRQFRETALEYSFLIYLAELPLK